MSGVSICAARLRTKPRSPPTLFTPTGFFVEPSALKDIQQKISSFAAPLLQKAVEGARNDASNPDSSCRELKLTDNAHVSLLRGGCPVSFRRRKTWHRAAFRAEDSCRDSCTVRQWVGVVGYVSWGSVCGQGAQNASDIRSGCTPHVSHMHAAL